MAVQFIDVESFVFLRKHIGPKNPLMNATITHFDWLFKPERRMLCEWICDFRIVLAEVFTVWSSQIYILARARWWGSNKAETRLR